MGLTVIAQGLASTKEGAASEGHDSSGKSKRQSCWFTRLQAGSRGNLAGTRSECNFKGTPLRTRLYQPGPSPEGSAAFSAMLSPVAGKAEPRGRL